MREGWWYIGIKGGGGVKSKGTRIVIEKEKRNRPILAACMSSCLTVCANINIGLFHFSFSITILVPLLFTPPPPLIPIYHQPSRIENVFITCFLHFLVDLVLYLVLEK